MKKIFFILIIISLAFGGRIGIGIAGGSQYDENYETITQEQIQSMFYGAKFNIQAETITSVYLEPSISYFNDPVISTSSAGIGLGLKIKPRLGNFPIVPSFGIEGTMLFYNDLNIAEAARSGQLNEYIETSTPRLMGAGYAGLSLFLGKRISIDCYYQYHGFPQQDGIEMVWAGLSYCIN